MTKFLPARTLLALVAALAGVAWAVLSWSALVSLHHRWTHFDEPYAIGYPALAISLWWVFRHRSALLQRNPQPAWSALAVVALAALMVAAGRLIQLQLMQQLGALALLWAIALLAMGVRAARLLLFPVLLLSLAIPLWDFLVIPLRQMTVWCTEHILDALRVPAFIDGFFITLPGGVVEVAGGCSGLNLLLAMLLMGLLFAESHYVPRTRRVAIVAVAAVFGVLENWIRVVALVLIAHHSDMQHPLVRAHGNFGWWIFTAGLLPYFWLAVRIERHGRTRAQPALQALRLPPWGSMAKAVAAAAVVVLAILIGTDQLQGRKGSAFSGFVAPVGAVATEPSWMPGYSGQDVSQTWRLNASGGKFELTALTYTQQSAVKKLIYYSNVIAEEKYVQSQGRRTIEPGFDANVAIVAGTSPRVVWWYWWVDGRTSTGALRTKLLQLRAMLTGDPSAALIVLSAPCDAGSCGHLLEARQPAAERVLMASRDMIPER